MSTDGKLDGLTNRRTKRQSGSLTCSYMHLTKMSVMKFLSGKKSKSVFDFLTYSREIGFSFSYEKVGKFHRPNEPSNEIDRVSKFDNSLSFGAKQNALW